MVEVNPDRPHAPRITLFPVPELFKKSEEVTEFGEPTKALETKLLEAMRYYQGVGFACNQLQGAGHQRIFVMIAEDDPNKHITVVNPTILETGPWVRSYEGCLSLPGVVGEVMRKEWVKVRYRDSDGNFFEKTFDGLHARIFLHEIGHLDGECIWHRMDTMNRKANAQHVALLIGPHYRAPWLDRSLRRLLEKETHKAHVRTSKRTDQSSVTG